MGEASAQSAATSIPRIGFVEIAGDGAVAGLYGASAIAVWFLIVDAITREALFTPSLVATALLSGAPPDPDAPIQLSAVAVATVIHSLLFIAFGIAYAWVLARLKRTPDYPLIAISVFVPLELGFIAGTRLLIPGVAEILGHGYIVAGNVFAALLMAFYLKVGQHHPDDDAAE
jgi:hypothetical protein